MACTNCNNCNDRGIKDSQSLPVAIFCDRTNDGDGAYNVVQVILCDDDGGVPFISRTVFDADGTVNETLSGNFQLDGVTPYTLSGAASVCASGGGGSTENNGAGVSQLILCDDNQSFIWRLVIEANGSQNGTLTGYFELDGVTPYTPTGTIIICSTGGGGGGGDATFAQQQIQSTRLGDLTETAPTNDTDSSGLNGRLQRIAQRLTSLIALLPTSLGTKSAANSLAVTLASDEPQNILIGSVTETAPLTDTASSGLNGRLQRIAQRLSSLVTIFPTSLGTKTATNSFPVTLASDEALNTAVGIVTETAPASDTASSGLNGRLQRIAQRITSLIALLPVSLGTKTAATSLAVTLSSDETLNTLVGSVTETAPATDTASSGLNGRLQRIAQRLTSLLPASLGAKTAANSLSVTLSSDEPLIGIATETAPLTDTASSGLNGRLQRIAQRLTSLIALFPTSLGTKTAANSFPVTLASDEGLSTAVGIVTETAPVSDTGSSGLNGRLQRIAQRLTSLIALLPTSLGTKTAATSLAVTLANDEPLIGIATETAPGTDTASSGLNGRLQRIAQRLTTLLAVLPTSIGTKTAANSLAVTLASDEPLIGSLTETAPVTDTGSSGLNGRLQRIAQRITSLIALFPTSLGAKTAANSFAVTLASDEPQNTLIGAITETAPASDTASSGLNGRLQRIAQRITSLIALVPTSLGAKTAANSFAVTLASDEPQNTLIGAVTETAPANDTASSGLNGRLQRIAQRLSTIISTGIPITSIAAGETVIGLVGASDIVSDVTLTLDTSTAYALGDLLADTQSVASVARVNNGVVVLESVTLIDEDDQGQPLTLFFLGANNTMGTENSAPSISDANARDILGFVRISAADYVDLGGVRIACLSGLGLEMQTASATTTLYIAAVSGGTGTYTASGIKLKLGFLRS